MSGYHDHDTLTSARREQLLEIARGKHPRLNRARINWYLRQGYLERSPAAGTEPLYRLADRGWEVANAAGIPRHRDATAMAVSAVGVMRGPS